MPVINVTLITLKMPTKKTRPYGLGAKLIYMSYFASLLYPQAEKLGYYFQLGTCLGAMKTHVLLSFLRSAFCKWHVINVTLLTLKIVVL